MSHACGERIERQLVTLGDGNTTTIRARILCARWCCS
jgi:hypothetical protein